MPLILCDNLGQIGSIQKCRFTAEFYTFLFEKAIASHPSLSLTGIYPVENNGEYPFICRWHGSC
jgi:hypothetical protein